MAGHMYQTLILVLLNTLKVALGQHVYTTTTTEPDSSTTKADIPDLILFYASPVITLIILILLVFCLTHMIRTCQRKFARTPTSTLPTVSAIVQNGTDADPPPPYTFTDVTRDLSKPEVVSVSNCPPYTKDPPTYLELTVTPEMTHS